MLTQHRFDLFEAKRFCPFGSACQLHQEGGVHAVQTAQQAFHIAPQPTFAFAAAEALPEPTTFSTLTACPLLRQAVIAKQKTLPCRC